MINTKSFTFIVFSTISLCLGCNKINNSLNIEEQFRAFNTVDNEVTTQYKSSNFLKTYFKDEMPIFGFISMPRANANGSSIAPSYINYSNFQMYKDAGFNIVCPLYQREPFETPDIRRELQICNDLDLKYVIRDLDFMCDGGDQEGQYLTFDQYKEMLQDKWYYNEPCVIGIQTADEPNYHSFKGMGNFYRALAEVKQDYWPFTTHVPAYGAPETWGYYDAMVEQGITDNFEGYKMFIRHYADESKTSYLLYDNYYNHVYREEMNPDTTWYLMKSLSFFANEARARDIVFMAAIATYRHGSNTVYSPKELRWTTNITLAYGAKGLEYYSYWPTTGGDSSYDSWVNPKRGGLVTPTGIPHDTYYTVKEINQNVKLVDEYLMNASFEGIQYYGNCDLIYLEEDDIINTQNDLYYVDGGDAFVGVFTYNNKPMYYIVNNSYDCGIKTFTAKFRNKVNVHSLNLNVDTITRNTYATSFNLAGGDAILLEVL